MTPIAKVTVIDACPKDPSNLLTAEKLKAFFAPRPRRRAKDYDIEHG